MKKQIILQTENGFQVLDLDISFDHDDLNEASVMIIKTNYQGKIIVASGNRYPWEDAYASLQKQLPENIRLFCCVACRHGNGCPVGDEPDKLFCTKDVLILRKSDLFYYTEDDDERQKRSKSYTDHCDDFQPQTHDYFIYNDYLLYCDS